MHDGDKNKLDWWTKYLQQSPSHWAFPTSNVEEISRRIEEIKAIGLWLDMQKQLLNATVQSLEIQRGTLQALSALKLTPEHIQSVIGSEQAAADMSKLMQTMMEPMQFWLQQTPNLFTSTTDSSAQATPQAGKKTKKKRNPTD